jgi:hypothetical protein
MSIYYTHKSVCSFVSLVSPINSFYKTNDSLTAKPMCSRAVTFLYLHVGSHLELEQKVIEANTD